MSEKVSNITAKIIARLRPPRHGRRDLRDGVVPGLRLRVSASSRRFPAGKRSWSVVAYGPSGDPQRVTLPIAGDGWEQLEPQEIADRLRETRALARQHIDRIHTGDSYTAERRQLRAEARANKAAKRETGVDPMSFAGVATDYFRRECGRLRRGWEIERIVRREVMGGTVYDWSHRPIAEITPLDVIKALDRLVDEGKPAAANKLLACLRRLCNWAIRRRVYNLTTSPCDRLEMPAPRVIRQRVLSEDEIAAVWHAASEYPYGHLVRMLLATGQRLSECANMTWAEIGKDGNWTIPPERCKSDRPHVVPLSTLALHILRSVPRFVEGQHVFSTSGGMKPIVGFSKYKKRLDREARLDQPFRIHDLRRTMRSGLSRLGVDQVVAERTINHAPRGLAAVYDQWAYLPERREALQRWGERLSGIVGPSEPGKVVRLHA